MSEETHNIKTYYVKRALDTSNLTEPVHYRVDLSIINIIIVVISEKERHHLVLTGIVSIIVVSGVLYLIELI
jgi:hypothetical protein